MATQFETLKSNLRAAGLEVRTIDERGPFTKLLVRGEAHSTTIIVERYDHGYGLYNFAMGKTIADDVTEILGIVTEI